MEQYDMEETDIDHLLPYLLTINIPTSRNKIYKDECMFSFDTPESESGLFISLTSFYGIGRDYLEMYHHKSRESIFLHVKREKREILPVVQGDGPESKIIRLAIGIEGGFNPDSKRKKYELIDKYKIVILPEFEYVSWPNEDFPEVIKLSVHGIIESQSARKLAELESWTGTWDGEKRIVTRFAENLLQLDNDKKIPPSGWKCEMCELRENLWLNLTDGTILCGRRFHDGSGGNNHAVTHFQETNYPLAVKLGTITKDGKADVFSYIEDDMVDDPKLSEHLAHWGINVATMEKTDKSMIELELDLNQKVGEWSTLQESDGNLTPIYGPGYTGLENLGNSCYLNCVMQMLFIIPDFIKKYYEEAMDIFEVNVADPANDFNTQMAKIGIGLLSGKYSIPPADDSPIDADSPGISPLMFKTLIGRNHADFRTRRQQDVQEYLSYIITLLERNNRNQIDPSHCMKFKLEERVQCNTSKKVKYTFRTDWMISLNIPLEEALNKEEVMAYEIKKIASEKSTRKVHSKNVIRPKISLQSCLDVFAQNEIIEQFFSSAINDKTTATKTTRLATFPDYLVIQLKKYTLKEDWTPMKLDVEIEMPDILDMELLRGHGQQPEESLLPDIDEYDEAHISELNAMGFPVELCKKAIFSTKNAGLEAATQWIMEHLNNDDDIDSLVTPSEDSKPESSTNFDPDKEALQLIMGLGFTDDQASKALKATNNNVDRAIDWIFSHPDDANNTEENTSVMEYKDGDSKYRLVGFISHMGQSTIVGHYVCHLLREDRWIIYNDNKVALSENPPKELGYLYLYERLENTTNSIHSIL